MDQLTRLLPDGVCILHAPKDGEVTGQTNDIDCAGRPEDPGWPLRLPAEWRLCQRLHYDITGWSWVLDQSGDVVWLDILDDPRGLGKYGFPTAGVAGGGGRFAPPGMRAAYLTLKRIRKGSHDGLTWQAIRDLAREQPDDYVRALASSYSNRFGARLGGAVLDSGYPGPELLHRARRRLLYRHLRRPGSGVEAIFRSARRWIERISRPTGFYVVVVGPDGTGKSTLAGALPGACAGLFRRFLSLHWRPGLLPRAGALARRPEGDPTEPHARPAHGPLVSLLLLAYYWLDFFVGGWVLVWPNRLRTGLVVVERGWWDLAADPLRYRMKPYPRVVRALGTMLPRPDLALILEAPSDVLVARKQELQLDESRRQSAAWRSSPPPARARRFLDTSAGTEEVIHSARNLIASRLEERVLTGLGAGWVALPRKAIGRWILPAGPRRVVSASLRIYQPVTAKGLAGWTAARVAAKLGAFRLLPKGEPPPRDVREVLAESIPPGGTLAFARGNHSNRHVALVLDRQGRAIAVAKIATAGDGRRRLREEAASIRSLGSLLPSPLRAPVILGEREGILLLQPEPWRPRILPWRLSEEVANALGVFFSRGSRYLAGELVGPSQGDCAPWNLLFQRDGSWVLLDWEDASAERSPLYDVFHYIVQGHALLGRPFKADVIDGLRGRGWVGRALRAYVEGAQIDADPLELFTGYLEATCNSSNDLAPDARRGAKARHRLLLAARS